tara:strand:+ start:1230 stop:2747 length:1518 start_codon:yes stop_codon:yes gene_type:complete
MAIRDFGTSLMSDVRQRKDQQTADNRRYARKQQKKELGAAIMAPIIAPIVKGVGEGVGEILGMGSSKLALETKDFLNNSEVYKNKLNVGKAEQLITEATKYRDTAKLQGTSIYDFMLERKATEAATQREIASPNTIRKGMEEEWKSMYMGRADVKEQAKIDSDYFESILKKADRFAMGKEKNTLDEIALEARPKTVVGALWNRLTGNATSIDVFNNTMSKLEQVTVANEVDALTFEKRKKMGEAVLNNGGSLSIAKLIAGAPATPEELKVIEASAKRGEKREELVPTVSVSSRGVVVTSNVQVTEQNGSVRIDTKVTQKLGPNDVMTSEDLGKLALQQSNIFDSVAKRFNDRGQQAFGLAFDALMQAKPKNKDIIEPLDILKMVALAAQPTKWTSVENIIKPLEPEVARQILEQNEAMTKVLQDVAASQLELAQKGNATEEAKEKSRLAQEKLTEYLVETVNTALNPTNVTSKNRIRIDAFLDANPNKSEEDAINYWKGKGDWYK